MPRHKRDLSHLKACAKVLINTDVDKQFLSRFGPENMKHERSIAPAAALPVAALPLAHPDRIDGGFRPVKAWGHFRKLVADKEDTEQVFHIINALRDRGFADRAADFYESALGAASLADRTALVRLLDDHAGLRALDEGTVGRAYLSFMEREGLTAQGLVDEYDRFNRRKPKVDDLLERYSNRLRDTHDLNHVLTGYGRDALGELCVLAFSACHTPNWGTQLIVWAGAMQIRKQVPRETNVVACIREARALGKAAANIAHQDIAALLREPLSHARARMKIGKPEAYRRAHDVMRAHGLNPAATALAAQAG
jgi:ubiquinone biosynthesis protein COQ4